MVFACCWLCVSRFARVRDGVVGGVDVGAGAFWGVERGMGNVRDLHNLGERRKGERVRG